MDKELTMFYMKNYIYCVLCILMMQFIIIAFNQIFYLFLFVFCSCRLSSASKN